MRLNPASSMAQMNNKTLLVTILILAAVVRFATVFLFFGDYYPTDDAAQWHQAALNFLNGRGLIVNEALKASRTPVPGLYIAAIYSVFGVSFRAVQIANILLGILTVWLAYDLVRRSFGDLSAFLAGSFVSLYPTLLLYTAYMLSETPVIMLSTAGASPTKNTSSAKGREPCRFYSVSGLFPARRWLFASGAYSHESHHRKSRMVEIFLSRSGEGPGWETLRPTLQRYCATAPLGSALPGAARRALGG